MESTEYDSTATTDYLYKGIESLYTSSNAYVISLNSNLPKYVGVYQLGGQYGVRIMFQKKPIWLHRTMMKLCFGIEWIDNTN